jgi:hypothetical protein
MSDLQQVEFGFRRWRRLGIDVFGCEFRSDGVKGGHIGKTTTLQLRDRNDVLLVLFHVPSFSRT